MRTRSLATAVLCGALFGAGLVISGMTDPAKVIGFLDVTRHWDPSLAFVMGGAVLIYAIAYRVIVRRRAPWFAAAFHVPARRDLDARLIVGAAIFGAGWGLAGLCPGPAVVDAAAGSTQALAFVAALLVGTAAARRIAR